MRNVLGNPGRDRFSDAVVASVGDEPSCGLDDDVSLTYHL